MKKLLIFCLIVAALGIGFWLGQQKKVPLVDGDLILYVEKGESEEAQSDSAEKQPTDFGVSKKSTNYQPADSQASFPQQQQTGSREAINESVPQQLPPPVDTSLEKVRLEQILASSSTQQTNIELDPELETTFSGSGKKVVLWHSYAGAEKQALYKVIKAFNAKVARDGYYVKPMAFASDRFIDALAQHSPNTNKEGPDVFIGEHPHLGNWIDNQSLIENIDFYVNDEMLDQFLPEAIEALAYKDTVTGLPVGFLTHALFYNKDNIAQAPKDSNEMIAAAKLHTDKYANNYGLAYPYDNYIYHGILQNAFGGNIVTHEGFSLNSSKNIAALRLLLTWHRQHQILPPPLNQRSIASLFNQGKVAMAIADIRFVQQLDGDINVGISRLPALSEANNQPMQPWYVVEGAFLVKNSKTQDEAFEFVKYLTSPESGKVLALEGNQSPANKLVYDYDEVSESGHHMAFFHQIKQAKPLPSHPNIHLIWDPIAKAMDNAIEGTATAKEALDTAQREVGEAIVLTGQ